MNHHLKIGQSYTFLELSKMEELSDAPALDVNIQGFMQSIQTSHVSDETLLKNCPAFADTLWRYEGTTDEWIPMFEYAGHKESLSLDFLLDWEPNKDPYLKDKNEKRYNPQVILWVTPKGSPREQYYDTHGEPAI